MAALQTAIVDEAGTQFTYIDSGAPPNNDTYTTLVIIHGYIYNAHTFGKLLALAHRHNLRIIALNRRDYAGSTPFPPSELAILTDAGQTADIQVAFLQARGLEIAHFLTWIIKEKNIPLASIDGKEGGLAVMGWSLGNLTSLAFLRYLNTYPKDVTDTLDPYLRAFYIYDADYIILGYPDPPGAYVFYTDQTIPSEHRTEGFAEWVSSYYKHPYYHPPNPQAPPKKEVSSFVLRLPKDDEVYRPSTHSTLTPAERELCLDPAGMAHPDGPIFARLQRSVLYDQLVGSLLLVSSPDSTSIFPSLKVRFIYCDSSIWNVSWCAWEIEKDLEKWKTEGRKTRPFRSRLVKDANHFLHWDDPNRFLEVILEEIRH